MSPASQMLCQIMSQNFSNKCYRVMINNKLIKNSNNNNNNNYNYNYNDKLSILIIINININIIIYYCLLFHNYFY